MELRLKMVRRKSVRRIIDTPMTLQIARDRDGQYHVLDADGNKRRPQYSHEEQLLKRIRERHLVSRKAAKKPSRIS